MAIPWAALGEFAACPCPPRHGDQWRIDFSRVEWHVDVVGGRYVKREGLPEENWVWSPQGVVDMHMPERWGYVQFSGMKAGAGTEPFVEDLNERVKWALRRLYYRQRRFRAAHGRFAPDLASLDAGTVRVDSLDFQPSMQATPDLYQITAKGFAGATVWLRHDGKTWVTR
jgi:hypothetical protein